VASNEEALKKLARSMNKQPEEMQLSEVKATEATTVYGRVPVVCREMEIAVLKSALLTFDHLLRGSTDRFTRHPELEPVRAFVRDAVLTRQADAETLASLSLGLQYEKTSLYERLRRELPATRTPFEHVLFVAADAPTRTLDLVWLVFGFDPFGFRLCHWEHGSFAYAVVNPVVKDVGYSGPHPISLIDNLLCTPTNRCSLPPSISDEREMQSVLDLISGKREDAYGQAVMLVETTCDKNLVECFREQCETASQDERSVRAQVRARLIRIYGRKKDDSGFMAEVDAALARHAVALPTVFLSRPLDGAEPGDAPDWPSVIRFYRDCLADLEQRFGLPGDSFTNSSGLVVDPSDQRLVGELPPMKL
jgi:hypothetical protein